MALEKFLVDLDLDNNQILNTSLQNLTVHPSVVGKLSGWIYFNTTDKTAYIYTGQASPNEWLDLGNIYTHPTQSAISPILSGNKVLATLTVNTLGHVTGATTRTLLPSDIGASSAGHTHTIAEITDVTASASELNLLDLAGLTTGWVLRATGASTATWGKLLGSQLTNDLNWVKIADGLTNATDTWSSTKIQGLINDLNANITGGLINKGGYDATTNTPKLSTTPIAGIKNGWTYVVTVAGNFFSEAVQAGDMIIAKQDTPTTLAHWTIVNKNIPDIIDASTVAKGIIQLATSAEVQAGTDALKAVTPATLSARTALTTRTGILSLATSAEGIAGTDDTKAVTPAVLKATMDAKVGGYSASFGNGSLSTFSITHNLGTTDVSVQITEVASGENVVMQVGRSSANVVTINCNNVPTTNQYRVIIKK